MCTVISSFSYRGVGVTTTTVNLGAALNRLGKKVLLIDTDPQCDLTNYFSIVDNGNNVFQAIDENVDLKPIEIIKGLDIIPSSIDLVGCELQLVKLENKYDVLGNLLTPLKRLYDYIIIDCPHSLGLLTVNAFKASDYTLSPIQSSEHLDYLISLVNRLNSLDFKIKVLYYINQAFSDTSNIMALEADTANVSYVGHIAYETDINKSKEVKKDVFEYNHECNAANNFVVLCNNIVKTNLITVSIH